MKTNEIFISTIQKRLNFIEKHKKEIAIAQELIDLGFPTDGRDAIGLVRFHTTEFLESLLEGYKEYLQ